MTAEETPEFTRIYDPSSEIPTLAPKTIVYVTGHKRTMYLGPRDERYLFLVSPGPLSAIEITIALEEIRPVKRMGSGSPSGALIFGEYAVEPFGKDLETGEYHIGFAARDPLIKEGKL